MWAPLFQRLRGSDVRVIACLLARAFCFHKGARLGTGEADEMGRPLRGAGVLVGEW